MRNYIAYGYTVTIAAPTGGVVSGEGVMVGRLFGVALSDAAAGQEVALQTRGVVRLPKTSALAIAVGDRLFWDAANKVVNKTSASQVCIGVAVSAAANPSATVDVLLGPAPPAES